MQVSWVYIIVRSWDLWLIGAGGGNHHFLTPRPNGNRVLLDRLHGNCQHVVHQADLFLDERLGTAYSRE